MSYALHQHIIILHLFSCRVALRSAVFTAAWIWPRVSQHLEISFGLRGPSSQAFTPFRGGLGWSPSAWGAPNKGNADRAVGIFGNAGRVWDPALRLDPPKKGLVPHLPVRWGVQQIPHQHIIICIILYTLLMRAPLFPRRPFFKWKPSAFVLGHI